MNAFAEVKIQDNQIIMTVSDFKALMGDLAEAEAERDALRITLNTERLSQDHYMQEVNELRRVFDIERNAWRKEVRESNFRSIWIGLLGVGIGAAID